MKTSRSKYEIIGHIASDATVQQMPEYKAQVLTFPVITNEYYRDKNGNTVDQKTTIRVTRWYPQGKNIENFSSALKSGAMVQCSGKPIFNAYINEEGEAITYPQMKANDIDILRFAKKEDEAHAEAAIEANSYPDAPADDLPF